MSNQFSNEHRYSMFEYLRSTLLDVLVIGGGITGAGILLDGQMRGMKVGLVEMQDFAAGTSSRSTKLVHGGLRYLKQLDIGLVAEVGRERAIVYENAPHVTTPLWMLLPIIAHGSYGKFTSSIGIYLYDRLAKVKRGERRKMLSASQALEKEPLLRKDNLKGAGYYVEYRTDDARLTLEIIKKAVDQGAVAVNYAKVDSLIYENGIIIGAKVVNLLNGELFSIRAKHVINATGPWVDELRKIDHSKQGKTLHLTKGVHLVIDGTRFPLQNPVYFDVQDGRMIFAIPRDGKTYVGTTDTDYHGDVKNPRVSQQDVDYLITCVNFMFPSVELSRKDIESFWAGVRPLIQEEGKSASEISRKDEIFLSKSGLITIAGGKLTGYRVMADKAVTHVAHALKNEEHVEFPPCTTDKISLSGGEFKDSDELNVFVEAMSTKSADFELSIVEARKLAHRYGKNMERLYSILESMNEEWKRSRLSAEVFASLQYGIQSEMVVTPSDFFIRRTGAMFFDVAWVRRWKDLVIAYMQQTLGWSDNQTEIYYKELEEQLREATEVL